MANFNWAMLYIMSGALFLTIIGTAVYMIADEVCEARRASKKEKEEA